MNIKHNINYFKKSENLKFIGAAILVVALFLAWFGPSIQLWFIAYAISPPAIIIGLVMFLIGASGRSSESDLDYCIRHATEGLETDFSDDIHYSKKVISKISPTYIEGYEYKDGVMLRKSKNGSLRSSEYTRSLIYTMSDRLYINTKTMSLVSDEVKKSTTEILFDDIKSIEIKKVEKDVVFGKKTFKTTSFRFTVTYGDSLFFSSPIFDSLESDNFVKELNRFITDYRKSKS